MNYHVHVHAEGAQSFCLSVLYIQVNFRYHQIFWVRPILIQFWDFLVMGGMSRYSLNHSLKMNYEKIEVGQALLFIEKRLKIQGGLKQICPLHPQILWNWNFKNFLCFKTFLSKVNIRYYFFAKYILWSDLGFYVTRQSHRKQKTPKFYIF